MYAPPPMVVPARAGRSGGLASAPILAICCLLFILFLIAATIILALIPVYLQRKNVQTTSTTPFYASGTLDQSAGGDTALDATNRASLARAIEAATGAPAGSGTVTNGAVTSSAAGKRKRRKLGLVRNRRDDPKAGGSVLIFLIIIFSPKCSSCHGGGFLSKFASFNFIVELIFFGISRSFHCLLRLTIIFIDILAIIANIAANAATSTTASVTQSVG